MKKSQTTLQSTTLPISRASALLVSQKASLSVQPLLHDLATTLDAVTSTLKTLDDYILVIDHLLKDKETPTQDVASLKERLEQTRSDVMGLKASFSKLEHEIVDTLGSSDAEDAAVSLER